MIGLLRACNRSVREVGKVILDSGPLGSDQSAVVLQPHVRSPCESNFPRAPARSGVPIEGRLVFVIVAPSVVSAIGGVELIITCLDGLSDTLGELANGHVRVKSRFPHECLAFYSFFACRLLHTNANISYLKGRQELAREAWCWHL